MREDVITLAEPPKRHPRKMLIVWTFGESDFAVKARILQEVVPYFPNILEVIIPEKDVIEKTGKVTKAATPGYIYIKIIHPSYDLYDAIERVKGVGGFVAKDYDTALLGMSVEDTQKLRDLVRREIVERYSIQPGDVVRSVTGLLVGVKGLVKEVSGSKIVVEVALLGRMCALDFEESELELVETREDGNVGETGGLPQA
jgi:transcription antitermination factor NusG